MNLNQRIILGGYDPWASDHAETFQVGTPIPTAYPPSLSNPKKVEPDTMQEGWQKKSSKRKKKRARRDMKEIVQKTLNQGRPTMVNHSKGSDPNLWNPSQIADL
jgi:hypothetical protein